MITEEARQTMQDTDAEDIREECQEIIKAAAIYERLETFGEWQSVKDHLKGVAKIHQDQINGWMAQLPGVSFFKRVKIMEVMLVHQVRKEQIEEALNYPERIMFQAIAARETLTALRKKEKAHAE